MDSIWSKKQPRIPDGDREFPKQAEVVIVGGGMAGLLCAYLLKESGIDAVVLEAKMICSGQTKNTTAKITSQHGLIYHNLVQQFGVEIAAQYGRINERAIGEFERIIGFQNIDCGFERLPAYLYTKTQEGIRQLEIENIAAQNAGIFSSIVYKTKLPFEVAAALKFENQAQIHPLEFLAGIVPELEIFENTRVTRIEEHEVMTERGTVRAGAIVLATHFPFMNYPGLYFARMHQERSYVVAIREKLQNRSAGTGDKDDTNIPNKVLDGMYYGIDADGLSFRNAEGMILVGGRSERTGVIQKGDPYERLRKEAKRMWPVSEEVAHWAAQDCMTLDKLPYIGRFSKARPYWYVATGFNKWGMTNSMIAAMAIRDKITGVKTPDWECVSPQRKLTGSAVGSLMKEMVMSTKILFTFQTPRCPHLGCRLVWNKYERTWDCPCHGSRFEEEGALIDNPAQKDLTEGNGRRE